MSRYTEYKNAKELYLLGMGADIDDESILEHLKALYPEEQFVLNESFMDWFKRNFSPKAWKLRNLGKEYFRWLMAEYNAKYAELKGSDETNIKSFLKREMVSKDIEAQIRLEAGKNEIYRTLSQKIVLKQRIKAKKEFATKILGPDDDFVIGEDGKLRAAIEDEDQAFDKASKADRKVIARWTGLINQEFEKLEGIPKEHATELLQGLLVFLTTRKNSGVKYSDKMVSEETKNGEVAYFEAVGDAVEDMDVFYVIGTRKSKEKRLASKKTIPARDFIDEKKEIEDKFFAIRSVSPSTMPGFVCAYLAVLTDSDKATVINRVSDMAETMEQSELIEISEKFHDMALSVNFGDPGNKLPKQILAEFDKLEGEFGEGDDEPAEDKPEDKPEDMDDKTDDKPDDKVEVEPVDDKPEAAESGQTKALGDAIESSDSFYQVVNQFVGIVKNSEEGAAGGKRSIDSEALRSHGWNKVGSFFINTVDIPEGMYDKLKPYFDDDSKVRLVAGTLQHDQLKIILKLQDEIESMEKPHFQDVLKRFPHEPADILTVWASKDWGSEGITEEQLENYMKDPKGLKTRYL